MTTLGDRLYRTSPADLELRGAGRTICGYAVPYGEPAEIRDTLGAYTETFRRGAFARSIRERADRVKFLAVHNRESLPIGRATLLREDPAGLYGEFRVSQTQTGDEVLELVRDGALDGLSIGFRPIRDDWSADRSRVERVEARLDEVSAVPFPAYAGAAIAGLRSALPVSIPASVAARRLDLILKAW